MAQRSTFQLTAFATNLDSSRPSCCTRNRPRLPLPAGIHHRTLCTSTGSDLGEDADKTLESSQGDGKTHERGRSRRGSDPTSQKVSRQRAGRWTNQAKGNSDGTGLLRGLRKGEVRRVGTRIVAARN